jgi:hypothetical protein
MASPTIVTGSVRTITHKVRDDSEARRDAGIDALDALFEVEADEDAWAAPVVTVFAAPLSG